MDRKANGVNRVWGGVLAVTGFIACPCHLLVTLPLLLGVLGGTSVGVFLAANTGLVYGLATGYFIAAIGAGVYLWNRQKHSRDGGACELPSVRRTKET